MYILYSLLATGICMIAYRYLHTGIDALVAGIPQPWLRKGLGGLLKLLALATTISIALLSILFFALQASAKDQKK